MAALPDVPPEEDGASFLAGAGFESDFFSVEDDFSEDDLSVDEVDDESDLSEDAAAGTVEAAFASDRLSVR